MKEAEHHHLGTLAGQEVLIEFKPQGTKETYQEDEEGPELIEVLDRDQYWLWIGDSGITIDEVVYSFIKGVFV